MDTGQSEGASLGYGSLAQASAGVVGIVDVSDDKENEAQLKLIEHELREL
jgi:hypothetical protein